MQSIPNRLESVTLGYERMHAEVDDNSCTVIEWKKKADMAATEAALNMDGCKMAEKKATAAR